MGLLAPFGSKGTVRPSCDYTRRVSRTFPVAGEIDPKILVLAASDPFVTATPQPAPSTLNHSLRRIGRNLAIGDSTIFFTDIMPRLTPAVPNCGS